MGIDTDNLIPRTGLEAWHKYVAGESGHEIIYDYSGNDLHIDTDPSDAPVLTEDVINGRPAWYFDGTGEALISLSSSPITVKHAFVLASFEEATLSDYQGLLTGKTNAGAAGGIVLLGDDGTDEIYDNTSLVPDFVYRKNALAFAAGNYKAPMNGSFALMEAKSATGMVLNGIQVGADRDIGGRKFIGHFVEELSYSREISGTELREIYEYFAIMFGIWQKNADGLNVWPFSTDWNRPLAAGKRVVSSTSVSGAYKARSKGTKKIGIEPQFDARTQDEYDAAVAFWDEHYPGTNFIYRDDSFTPARDTEMRFVSNIEQNAASFNDINYSWQAEEV